MDRLVKKYEEKLVSAGLASPSGPLSPLVGGLDDTLVWNRPAWEIQVLTPLFERLSINSLVYLKPSEPYRSLISFLARSALSNQGLILPKDCETRTFLHDLPVIHTLNLDRITQKLARRKCVIIAPDSSGPAILAQGTVSPEQGFVTTSSVCFACFVKFFTDYLEELQQGKASREAHALFDALTLDQLFPSQTLPSLMPGPFTSEDMVYKAMIEAGKATVAHGLVDSYFGNLSCLWNNTLYISQTGSSLDELEGCIDPVPLDDSSSAGLTASSELTAHLETISRTGCRTILHGHPRFSVILSMICDPLKKAECQFTEQCHTRCPEKRFAAGVPIVPGEVGTGPFGLCNTLPGALEHSSRAIVYGHGLFNTGLKGFSEAFQNLWEVENRCREVYLKTVAELRTTEQQAQNKE